MESGLNQFMTFKDKFSGILSMVGGSDNSFVKMFDKLKDIKEKTIILKDIMKDSKQTTFIGVCIPEFLSVYETERLV